MLRAYALVYALFVSLMIALFSSGILMVVYLNTKVTNLENYQVYKDQLIEDGMNLFLDINAQYPYDTDIVYRLYQDEKSEVVFKKIKWGLYDVLTVKVNSEPSYYRSAITGMEPTGRWKDALYVTDNFRSLILTGNTKLTGAISVPQSGVQAGYMNGISYANKELFYGIKQYSDRQLPAINKSRIDRMFAMQLPPKMQLIESDSIDNSFNNPLNIYYTTEAITLQNNVLKNNCMVVSEKKIKIKNTTHYENCILVAPIIEVENNTTGAMQLFATDTLWLGESVTLTYPSIVCVKSYRPENLLHISENATIYGEVYLTYPSILAIGYTAQLELEKNALIMGFCYSEGNAKINGIINGTLWANMLIYTSPQSTYQNYLHDAIINVAARNKYFVGSQIQMPAALKSTVIQWVP